MITAAFVAGAFFGAAIGTGTFALIAVSKAADERAELINREEVIGMGEAIRRQLAGSAKPDWPKDKMAKWKLNQPSKYIRWISENTGPNRAERRRKLANEMNNAPATG